MNRYLILSITFQRTHCQVPAAAPARDNTVETQRPEQVMSCGQYKGECLVPVHGAWEDRGTSVVLSTCHLWLAVGNVDGQLRGTERR